MLLVGSKWYTVTHIQPIGDGWIRVFTEELGKEFYFTQYYTSNFLLTLGSNKEEYDCGTRVTNTLAF